MFIFATILFIIFTIFFVVLSRNDRGAIFANYNSIDINGVTREYRVHLPKGYSPDKSYPVVFAFHGFSDRDKFIELYSGLSNYADKKGFIVVYPKGLNQSWNAEFCCGPSWRQDRDDVGFVEQLVRKISSDFPIDKEKVFATGFSNGGMFAQRLAYELPGTFKAIAAVMSSSGKSDKQLELKSTKTNILLINGRNDPTIPLEKDGASNSEFAFISAFSTRTAWMDTLECTKIDPTSSSAELMCRDGTVLAWKTTDDRHSWPSWRLMHPLSRVAAGTESVWEFFSRF